MSSDHWQIVGIAAGWSGAVGLVGLVLIYLIRRLSMRWLVAGVALVAVAAVVAGVLGTSRAMFLSSHDLGVVVWVSVVAGAVAVVVGAVVGAAVVRWSGALRAEARRFGQSGEFVATSTGTEPDLKPLIAAVRCAWLLLP